MSSKQESTSTSRKRPRERSESRLKHSKRRRSDEPSMQDTPTSGGNSAAFDELFEQISGISEAVNSLDQCFSSLEAAATSNGSERNNNDHGRNRTLIGGGGRYIFMFCPTDFFLN